MKLNRILGLLVAGALLGGVANSLVAQNAPTKGPKGNGYGRPAQSNEERAARQAACLEKNGGVCPNGGAQATCPGDCQGKGQGLRQGNRRGQGKGQGNGQGNRHGLRNGTGPRSANGTCPNNQPAAQE